MKLPKWIQKWIRKQFNNKTVCDLCLEPYTYQTKAGALLCKKCEKRSDTRSRRKGLTGGA